MGCFRLLFGHLAWIKHQFLSGIRDSRKAGSLWGMMRGVGGVRKSMHQSWLAKGLGLGLLCWGFKGVQDEIPSVQDFRERFLKLLERYKCIADGGDYFEGNLSFMCVLSIKVPIRKKSGNLFNDPRICTNQNSSWRIKLSGILRYKQIPASRPNQVIIDEKKNLAMEKFYLCSWSMSQNQRMWKDWQVLRSCQKTKRSVEYESNGDTNCNGSTWNGS